MILTLVFLILKLCDVIAWSWWWIFSPLWIPAAIILLGTIASYIYYLVKIKEK